MNNVYKFLNKEHIKSLKSGRFCFGRLRRYQLLEIAHNDRFIGDRKEGLGVSIAEGIISSKSKDGLFLERLEKAKVLKVNGDTSAEINMVLKNNKIVFQTDAFVFCVSHGNFEQLRKVFNCYGGCIKISDLKILADLIWNEGFVNGKKISEVFSNCVVREVFYCERNIKNLQNEEPDMGSPFLKDNFYLEQSEIRIVLYPIAGIHRASQIFVDVKADKIPDEFLTEILTGSPTIISEEKPKLSLQQVKEGLLKIKKEIENEMVDEGYAQAGMDWDLFNENRRLTQERVIKKYENNKRGIAVFYLRLIEENEDFINEELERDLIFPFTNIHHIYCSLNYIADVIKKLIERT